MSELLVKIPEIRAIYSRLVILLTQSFTMRISVTILSTGKFCLSKYLVPE